LAPAGKLLDRIPDEIAQVLALHGVDPATVAAERQAMAEVRIAPTNDRSVVGVMNELAFLGERCFDGDLVALSLRMAGTPVGPLRSSHGFPDEALAALLRATAPSDEPMAEVIPFPGMTTPEPSVAARPSRTAASVFQLKVTLLNTKPPVWRRILVDSGITLDRLHEVIQAAFGWWNCHLHEFEIAHRRYGVPDPDFDFGPPTIDERTARLTALVGEGASFHYTYDFGDDWRHKVTVEKVTPAGHGTTVPDCIGGRRACPPEDCGGPWGYQDLLESLSDGSASRDDRLDFVGHDFAPGDFSLNLANVRNTHFDS